MGIMQVATLPLRMGYAYAEASIGIARLFAPGGPVRLLYRLADLADEDRPLGVALAPGGAVDRLLAEGGVLVQLTDFSGPVGRLIAPDGPVDRLTSSRGPLDRVLAEDGLVDQLIGPGGAVDQLLRAAELLSSLVPVVDGLDEPARRLTDAAAALTTAVRPLTTSVETLSELALRVPGNPIRRWSARSGERPDDEGEPPPP